MNISYKNRLQEYYQKNAQPLPEYTHNVTSAGWSSVVTIHDGRRYEAEGRTKKDADQEAAKLAFEAITKSSNFRKEVPKYEILAKPQRNPEVREDKTPKIDVRYPGCILVLIDLENSPNVDKRWLNIRWDCCSIEAFAGKLSSHATKDLKSLYPFVDKFHIVDSGHKDACDHAISFRAGRWIENIRYINMGLEHGFYNVLDRNCDIGTHCGTRQMCSLDDAIFIVSKDRFAAALVDVLKQSNEKVKTKIKTDIVHFTNMNDCLEELSRRVKWPSR